MRYLPGDEPAARSDIDVVRHEFRSDMASVRAELRAEISVLSARMDAFEERMGRFEVKLDDRMDAFHHALLTQGPHLCDLDGRLDHRHGGSRCCDHPGALSPIRRQLL